MSSTKQLYRATLRELRLASRHPRATRNPVVATHLRSLVESAQAGELDRILLETRDFMRSSRIHAELLKRYNPTADMTTEERVQATARRVGLNTPLTFKAEDE